MAQRLQGFVGYFFWEQNVLPQTRQLVGTFNISF